METVETQQPVIHADTSLANLMPALEWLDHRLEGLFEAAKFAYGLGIANDPFRGLHISTQDAELLLSRLPCEPLNIYRKESQPSLQEPVFTEQSRLGWLRNAFGLSQFDLEIILIVLAPELDLRYDRIYAYLQDDVSRHRPSVDLVLNLLCPTGEAKLSRRVHFSSEAPLIRNGLIHLLPDPNQGESPLLANFLKLDDQIVQFVLGQKGLDRRLASFCMMIYPDPDTEEFHANKESPQALAGMVKQARNLHRPLRFYFHGLSGAGKRKIAGTLASQVNVPLLVADLSRITSNGLEYEQVIKTLFMESWLQDAVLYLDSFDAVRSEERLLVHQILLDELANSRGVVILAGSQPWRPDRRHPLGVVVVHFSMPDVCERRALWESNLSRAGIHLPSDNLTDLANRYLLTPNQIVDALSTTCNEMFVNTELPDIDRELFLSSLFAAARAQSGHELSALAIKVEPRYTWNDIVLPEDALDQLHEICQWVRHYHRVFGEWGFDQKLSLGKGVTALFAGSSGTGKSMAAEIIAHELNLDLYKVDLSAVVSKYIGETEKNLNRIFEAAENANAILFFDEADALFGKRSEVRDAHDRYANIEISYLLQKMESYEGTAILATNLIQNLDDAFARRLAFTVYFPFPSEDDRLRIWRGIWPNGVPLGTEVDLAYMAGQFMLSGGNIKNIALSAAFLAVADGGTITMPHLLHAVQREYQKLGKSLSEKELMDLWRAAGR